MFTKSTKSFNHFQQNIRRVIYSERQMIQKACELEKWKIAPILNMVMKYDIFQEEYEQTFNKYQNTFHVITPDIFGRSKGEMLININHTIANAINNNCKLIINDQYNIRDLVDSYVYNFNTKQEIYIYKMYDMSKTYYVKELLNDIKIHKIHDIRLGAVLKIDRIHNDVIPENTCENIKKLENLIESAPELDMNMIITNKNDRNVYFSKVKDAEMKMDFKPMQEIVFTPDCDYPYYEEEYVDYTLEQEEIRIQLYA